MINCSSPDIMVEERIDRVLTQYRESPKLLFLLRTYMRFASEIALQICDLPEKFQIETAEGDQLTLIGKRIGWPRCHCVCELQPVFGFECDDRVTEQSIAGFCDENVSWLGCDTFSTGTICIEDDEIYRKFLKVRLFQMQGFFDLESLEECLAIFFGDQARILHSGDGRIVIAPGRMLTNTEIALLQLYPRVLPVALGIETRFHFSEPHVFGFGDGWGGFCDSVYPTDESYERTGKIFGFCEDQDDEIGGFCEEWIENSYPIETHTGINLVTNKERILILAKDTDNQTGDSASWLCRVGANWMCEVDVRPYTC